MWRAPIAGFLSPPRGLDVRGMVAVGGSSVAVVRVDAARDRMDGSEAVLDAVDRRDGGRTLNATCSQAG